MQVDVDFENAQKRHPELVQQIMDKMNSGSSRAVGDPPESFTWRYTFMLSMQAMSFQEMLDEAEKKAKEGRPTPENVTPVAERVENLRERVVVYLEMKRGSTAWKADQEIEDEVPPEVEAWLHEKAKKEYEEQMKFAQMSDEELEESRRKTLRKLWGAPGFVGLEIDDDQGRSR